MDQTNNNQNQKCCKHQNNLITFVKVSEVNNQTRSSIFYCIDCVNEDLTFKGIDYVLIQQIIQESQKNIVQKWPPVNNYQILENLSKEIANGDSSIQTIQQINNFFNELKEEILKKIDFCEKKMINQALNLPFGKEQILKRYQEISQIGDLKQILLNGLTNSFDQQENQCRVFLSEVESKKESNSQELQTLLDQCMRKKQLVDFENSKAIRQSIYSLIDQINFFPLNFSSFQNVNNNINFQNTTNSDKIIQLVSNKSNFCTQQFLDQLKQVLSKVEPIFNEIPFDSIFQQNKQPIRFAEISQEKLQEINEYTEHLIKLQNDITFEQIQSSQRIKKILQVFENKANFITNEMKIYLSSFLVEMYPFLRPLDSIEVFSQQDGFNSLQNQSEEVISTLIQILQKKQKLEMEGIQDSSVTQNIIKQAPKIFMQFEQSELDKVFLNFPVFDVLKSTQIDILKNFEMQKSSYKDGNQRIQIIKNLDSTCEIFINQQYYIGKYRNDVTNCISSNILEKDKKYIFRIEFEVGNENDHYFYVGLMQKSKLDLKQGYEQKLTFQMQYSSKQFLHFQGDGIDKYIKGSKLVRQDRQKTMIEMRIWLGGEVLQVLDYPSYQNQIELRDEYKKNLTELDDLCLYFYLCREDRRYKIKEAFQTKEFILC